MNAAERLLLEALMLPTGNFPSVLPPRPAWTADALCKEYPEVNFFPDRGQTTAAAKAICERCSVRDECLQEALDRGETHGVWGGTSYRDRRRIGEPVLVHSSGYVAA